MAPLPIALATSSPERRQRNLARGIAETLDDSIELARRFRERRSADQPHVGGVRAPELHPTYVEPKSHDEP